MSDSYDLIVIGAGSGGVRAARVASQLGARVAVCEKKALGGTCVNAGCVPKKLFVYASHYRELFKQAAGYGWQTGDIAFHWSQLRDNTQAEIRRLNGIYQQQLLKAGVEIITGEARITSDKQVSVNGQQLATCHIIIATGGTPFMPDIPGITHAVNSDQVFTLATFPEKIVIIGGGYIATEFAGIFHGLGSQVTLVNRGPAILGSFDAEISKFVAGEMQRQGIEIINHNELSTIEPANQRLQCHCLNGDSLTADTVLVAAGRQPQSREIFDASLDIHLDDAGHIQTDINFETSQSGIYAIGDVTGGAQLTPVAIKQGQWLARHLFAAHSDNPAMQLIPTTVFGHPPLASVGLSEADARDDFDEIDTFTTTFSPMRQSLGGGKVKMMMKVVCDKTTDKVLGIHIAGDDAAEILQGFAAAMQAGITKHQLDQTLAIHPTSAEELVTLS